MNESQKIVWLTLVALLATSAQAQLKFELPDGYPDVRTQSVQAKAEELFQRGNFGRAYFIYRNELVPTGDKYAQYMVGYMHLMGIGTDEDPVTAYSWYRLAAERGTPEFVAVRDQLMHDLQAEERRRSDEYYLQLRREFSDLVILLAEIRRNLPERKAATGSRIPSESATISVVDTRTPALSGSSADYYGGVRRQLEKNLKMLSELGNFPNLETDPDRVDIDELERLVKERVESPEG